MTRFLLLSCAILTGLACTPTSQEPVRLDLAFVGRAPQGPLPSVGEVQVELQTAQLAVGPLYLCSGKTAGELCELARAEWVDAAVVDLLSDAVQPVGELHGTSGPVRSWMYDLGVTSSLTSLTPTVLPAAQALGGVSMRASGMILDQGRRVPFEVALTLAQDEQTELGVPVIRKSAGTRFLHELSRQDLALQLIWDPAPLFEGVDLRGQLVQTPCERNGPRVACDADTEQQCGDDATVLSRRDCRATGQFCVQGVGCANTLQLQPGDRAYRGLEVALSTRVRPEFVWIQK